MIVLAAAGAALAAATIGASVPASRRRLRSVLPAPPVVAHSQRAQRRTMPIVITALAAVGGAAMFGVVGFLAGAVIAAVAHAIRPPAAASRVDPAEVAMVVDLLAGCVAAGASVADGLDAVAVGAGPVLVSHCRPVAGALRAGAPVDEAWASWLADPVLSPIARSMIRTGASGAAVAEELRRGAERLRARRRTEAQLRVRRASVWLVVPLGLCFLPAFVLVAVVPLVIGLVPALR